MYKVELKSLHNDLQQAHEKFEAIRRTLVGTSGDLLCISKDGKVLEEWRSYGGVGWKHIVHEGKSLLIGKEDNPPPVNPKPKQKEIIVEEEEVKEAN